MPRKTDCESAAAPGARKRRRLRGARRFREVRLPGGTAAPANTAPLATRLPSFVGMEVSPHEVLGRLRVMVVGAGSVGHLVALHLARLQVGEIRIVDPSPRHKAEGLLTHAALPPSALGKPKALWCARQCKRLSQMTGVFALCSPVQSLPLAGLQGLDLVVLATDNVAAEVEAARRAMRHGVPLVQGAVYGEMLVATARFWTNADPAGPCPVCALSAQEWQSVSSQTYFRCSGNGAAADAEEIVAPTMSTSSLCSMAADLVLMVALRHVLGLGKPLGDCAVEYCGYNHRTNVTPLTRNHQCPAEHARWETCAFDRPVGRLTPRALAQAALGCEELPEDLAFTVGEALVYVQDAPCCGFPHPISRFAREGTPVAACPRCGADLLPHPFHCHRPVPATILGPLMDRTFSDIGAGSVQAILVQAGNRSILCRRKETEKP